MIDNNNHELIKVEGKLIVSQAVQFLSGVAPFSFLPGKELKEIADHLYTIRYPKNTVLFFQGQSRMDNLYIIQKGAAERYYEENDRKILHCKLSKQDMYGGISMLLNNGIAVRTIKSNEDLYLYALPKNIFLDICARYESFSDFFTDTFGKRMLDRSYAEIFAKSIKPEDKALQFFNQPVSSIFSRIRAYCDTDLPVRKAAVLMNRNKCSAILIKRPDGEFVGIVTDTDLRKKVIATGCDIEKPVSEIISSPLTTISAQTLIVEALLTMMQKNIKHLAVTDSDKKVVGMVTNRDLLIAQGQSPLLFIRDINSANSVEQIIDTHKQLPGLIQSLINSGAKANNVTMLITMISDAISDKLIRFAINELGTPPASFVFMILGSEGRKEQTLKTDQDNAIIFKDVSEESLQSVQDYFIKLGEKVCTWLDRAGYAFCKGDVMAKNPRWCQPLSVWKEYFSTWIHAAEPEDLLQSSIFFDFRGGYGNKDLIVQLRKFLFDSLGGWSGFFRHLTENALHFKPPIGFFRNFVVESKGEHRNSFDIKNAMMPIVDFARIYALKNRIEETNTQERLNQLYLRKILSWQDYNEVEQAYSFLMQMRFMRQVASIIEENEKPDNYINPKKLSSIEQTMLKEIFKRIEKIQSKLGFEFTGLT
ncbi:MAG: cyclic nucleotide-binding/CBS domain-containing protein [Deltaproteobacteria bacterium]|nr:cyclic nucleotide-binding/CBS domain-containing protein [Deltaproteobacteria bacterium]MBW2661679.1 cyclic nucleotide-binding/CBS domain-containing protein [Deltaproteobacteria bacterium]